MKSLSGNQDESYSALELKGGANDSNCEDIDREVQLNEPMGLQNENINAGLAVFNPVLPVRLPVPKRHWQALTPNSPGCSRQFRQ